jgi:hypothetical protein
MICEDAEVAEVRILAPEVVAKRWREGVEAMAFSPDILKFGITEPAVPKFEKFDWFDGQSGCAGAHPPCDFVVRYLRYLRYLCSLHFQAKIAGV